MLLCAEFVKFNMLQSNLSGVLGEVQLVGLDLSCWSLEFICSYVLLLQCVRRWRL